jgi:hypothetical protein
MKMRPHEFRITMAKDEEDYSGCTPFFFEGLPKFKTEH